MLCIYYLLRFQKITISGRALIDLDNKINIMILAYASKLGLKARHTIIGAQKIDSSIFITFEVNLTSFQIKNKIDRAWFF